MTAAYRKSDDPTAKFWAVIRLNFKSFCEGVDELDEEEKGGLHDDITEVSKEFSDALKQKDQKTMDKIWNDLTQEGRLKMKEIIKSNDDIDKKLVQWEKKIDEKIRKEEEKKE